LLGFLLLYISHKVAPTNLAEPGLDMLVLLLLFISILYLFIRTLVKKSITVLTKIIIAVVHILGIAVIFWWMNQSS
jgi:competence protein ComGC